MASALRVLVLLGLLAAVDGFWIEPRLLLWRDEVVLDLPMSPLRAVHLSDLHVARESGVERRLLAKVASERPDVILLSGDLVADTHRTLTLAERSRAAATVLTQLRAVAPLYAVQGHSEYVGPVVATLASSGLVWLSNEGVKLGGERPLLLLGLNQQVGRDRFEHGEEPPFVPVDVDGERAVGRTASGLRNGYYHYDPLPGPAPNRDGLLDTGGPLEWTSYTAECQIRLGTADAEAGLTVLSRYVVGEDRMLQVRRPDPEGFGATSFSLIPHGTGLSSGELDTGVAPKVGRWYLLKVQVEVEEKESVARMKAWPHGESEPDTWQAEVRDDTPHRMRAGTVGLWARTGTAAFRHLSVKAPDGTVLLSAPMTDGRLPAGFREGLRDTRLAMALARSPEVPVGTPRLVLAHTPEPTLEAAWRGLEAVLVGHTHGGQVRLPGRAIITRSQLGTYYDRGLFHFAAPNRLGWTQLYINSGVGTSNLPVRFLCPPRYAVVEMGQR